MLQFDWEDIDTEFRGDMIKNELRIFNAVDNVR